MAERLRELLERPLDPRAARAATALAAVVFAGLAALWLLAGPGGTRLEQPARSEVPAAVAPEPVPASPPAAEPPDRPRPHTTQDPQDRPGSAAAGRARRALATHRALQHLPYRRGALRITLVGARGTRAVLAVSAPTLAAARAGWRAFLARYRDSGRSYLPRFRARGGRRG